MKWLPHMTKIGILQKLCKCMLQLSEVMLLTEMLSENVHLEVLEMAGKKYITEDIKGHFSCNHLQSLLHFPLKYILKYSLRDVIRSVLESCP